MRCAAKQAAFDFLAIAASESSSSGTPESLVAEAGSSYDAAADVDVHLYVTVGLSGDNDFDVILDEDSSVGQLWQRGPHPSAWYADKSLVVGFDFFLRWMILISNFCGLSDGLSKNKKMESEGCMLGL